MDENGHGTHVAGILRGERQQRLRRGRRRLERAEIMRGPGPECQGFQSREPCDHRGGQLRRRARGQDHQLQRGPSASPALHAAFLNAQEHGVICVVAAGNSTANVDNGPRSLASFSTSLNNVVSVAATTNTNQLAWFSNYGVKSVDLAAPGDQILSTLPNNKYGKFGGTSMAAPEVSGALALVWGLHPSWSDTEVINQVLSTTQKLPGLDGKVENRRTPRPRRRHRLGLARRHRRRSVHQRQAVCEQRLWSQSVAAILSVGLAMGLIFVAFRGTEKRRPGEAPTHPLPKQNPTPAPNLATSTKHAKAHPQADRRPLPNKVPPLSSELGINPDNSPRVDGSTAGKSRGRPEVNRCLR